MFAREPRARVRGTRDVADPRADPRRPPRGSGSRENVGALELNQLRSEETKPWKAAVPAKSGPALVRRPTPLASVNRSVASVSSVGGVLRRAASPGPGALRRTSSSHALSSSFASAPPAAARPKSLARRPASAGLCSASVKSSHADALELEVTLTEGLREVRSRDLETDGRNARLAPGTMTPANLRIYEELFDAIIERDKVFGGLLRKVKTAYSAYLGGAPAAQDSALREENAALKLLVERLHAEMGRLGDARPESAPLPTSPSPIRAEQSPGATWPDTARSEDGRITPDGPGARVGARPFARPKSVPSLNLTHVQQMVQQETARSVSSLPLSPPSARSESLG